MPLRELPKPSKVRAIWVHAIELYLRIIDGPASGLPVRIEKAKSELDSLDTPEAQAIAADLAHHQNPSEKSRLSWAAMSMPMLTTAAPVGQKQAILYCVAGAPPGIRLEGGQTSGVELSVEGATFGARIAQPTLPESKLLNLDDDATGSKAHIYRFDNVDALFAAIPSASGTASVRADGKTVGEGRPLDALLRFASQCKKLRQLPPLTDEDLRPKPLG